MELKQQLELMKMCGKVNKNPTLSNNPNFKLLVSKCSGIVIPDDKIIKPEVIGTQLKMIIKKKILTLNLWVTSL